MSSKKTKKCKTTFTSKFCQEQRILTTKFPNPQQNFIRSAQDCLSLRMFFILTKLSHHQQYEHVILFNYDIFVQLGSLNFRRLNFFCNFWIGKQDGMTGLLEKFLPRELRIPCVNSRAVSLFPVFVFYVQGLFSKMIVQCFRFNLYGILCF